MAATTNFYTERSRIATNQHKTAQQLILNAADF